MAGRIAIILLAALLGAAAAGSRGSPAFAAEAYLVAVDERAALDFVSRVRRQYGQAPVRIDPQLNRLAQEQAAAMARADQMSHTVAGSFLQRLRGRYAPAGENIAWLGSNQTLDRVMQLWVESPGHLSNMVMSGVTVMGIGSAVSSATGRAYFALILGAPL